MTDDANERELIAHNRRCDNPQWVEIDEDWPRESISLNHDMRRPTWASINYCLSCGTLWSMGHVVVPAVSAPAHSDSPVDDHVSTA